MSRSFSLAALAFVGVSAVAAQPVLAEERTSSITAAVSAVQFATDGSFLVDRMTPRNAEQQSANGNVRHEGIGIGVKGGFLWPSFADAQGAGFENNTGWLLGIFFGGNRPGTIGAMGEIQYGKRGASKGTIDVNQYFLEIPILARINVGANSLNGVSVYGLVGPVFDINLQTKQNNVNVKDNYESLDVGLLIGGGVEVTRFLIEARYNKGFKNVLKATGGANTDNKTSSFAIELGVRFN